MEILNGLLQTTQFSKEDSIRVAQVRSLGMR